MRITVVRILSVGLRVLNATYDRIFKLYLSRAIAFHVSVISDKEQ